MHSRGGNGANGQSRSIRSVVWNKYLLGINDWQDQEKELFFRNVFAGGKTCSSFFGIMQIMYHGDGRPVLPLHIKWLERMVSTKLLRLPAIHQALTTFKW